MTERPMLFAGAFGGHAAVALLPRAPDATQPFQGGGLEDNLPRHRQVLVHMNTDTELGLGSLVGAWRLKSEVVTFSDTGERVEPHGSDPEGWMTLSAGGRIMFLFGAANRQPAKSDADRASLFNTMVAYTGKVRLDGPGRIVTTVDLAMNPLIRGEQVRFFSHTDNQLTIRTAEQTIPIFGERLLVIDLIWIRES